MTRVDEHTDFPLTVHLQNAHAASISSCHKSCELFSDWSARASVAEEQVQLVESAGGDYQTPPASKEKWGQGRLYQ